MPFRRGDRSAAKAAWTILLLICGMCFHTCGRAEADDSLRVRIAWGGSQGRVWEGSISLSEGRLADPCPLGIEADEPGSMWLEDGRLLVRQKTPRLYDGLDIEVMPASQDAVLRIGLCAAGQVRARPVEIPVAELKAMVAEQAYNAELDERGTRLLIRRAPGDTLRLRFERSSLVFSPGETFQFSVLPHQIPELKGRRLRVRVDVFADRGKTHKSSYAAEVESLGPAAAVAMNVDLPDDEGVYDLLVSAEQVPSVRIARVGSLPLGWKQTVAQRRLQLVVISRESPRRPGESEQAQLRTVAQIDPANPRWLERLAQSAEKISLSKLPALQAFLKGPISSGHLGVRKHPLGELAELSPAKPGHESWEAYTLPIRHSGKPHILEVEYPSDVSQTMGISVLEPDAAGALLPVQLDSGVDVVEEVVSNRSQKPRMLRHRLIFWPRSNTPIVLITNRRHDTAALYGRIRVLAGWDHLPTAWDMKNEIAENGNAENVFGTTGPGKNADDDKPDDGNTRTRMAAAYMDRPLFAESFSASEAYDAWSRRSLDDWQTFHEAAARMIEYLQYVGYDGLMLSVLADGATIYPSRLLQPTPRYDKGVFFDSAQDPVRKDVLEMLLRMFDRRQLRLIAALEFASPLPELEALLRSGDGRSAGIRCIGPEGRAWQDVYEPRRQRAPYYNVLNARVQDAMLRVVRELLDRYAEHESLAGVGLQLCGYGYAQLPGPDWGLDDATVAEFQSDTGIRLDGAAEPPAAAEDGETGAERFNSRWRQLSGPYRNQWLRWRAARLSAFYNRIQAEIAKARPGARLYLVGAEAFASEESRSAVRPALPRRVSMAEMLLRIGIDQSHYRDPQGIVLLRPQIVTPCKSYSADAVNLEIEQMPDRDAYFAELPCKGNLFFHQPRELRLESFDRKSPFDSSFTLLSSQIMPSGARNRRRWVHALASLDSRMLFEGGWLMPIGQEDALREFLAAYRHLPAVDFKRLHSPAQAGGTQPLSIRYAAHNGCTYLYVVNDSPLSVRLDLRLQSACGETFTMEELGGRKDVPRLEGDAKGMHWRPALAAYDLLAVRFSRPDVVPADPEVTFDADVEKTLNERIRELGARANALRAPPLLRAVINSDFERPSAADGEIPGWIAQAPHGANVEFQRTPIQSDSHKPQGIHCVSLRSEGPVASLESRPFRPPDTGRLKMFVWLCVPKSAQQPTLRWSLVGKINGREFSRTAVVGRSAAHRLGHEWGLYEFPVNNLPLQGLDELRIRFDLLGPGEVWVDDVQLSHLEFEKRELWELGRLIQTADLHLRMNQVGDCIRLLEGYWPRFLEANVPMPAATILETVAAKPGIASKPQQKKDAEKQSGWFGRVKGMFSRKLW